jgi:hypothetical protein
MDSADHLRGADTSFCQREVPLTVGQDGDRKSQKLPQAYTGTYGQLVTSVQRSILGHFATRRQAEQRYFRDFEATERVAFGD